MLSREPLVVFSGGSPSGKKRRGLTLKQGRHTKTLYSDTIIDFVCLTNTPWAAGTIYDTVNCTYCISKSLILIFVLSWTKSCFPWTFPPVFSVTFHCLSWTCLSWITAFPNCFSFSLITNLPSISQTIDEINMVLFTAYYWIFISFSSCITVVLFV